MKTQDDTWDRLIEQLTSGEKVDWDFELARYPEDFNFIEQLKSLEKIYSVLNTSSTSKRTEKGANKQYQFNWGHLQVIEPIGEGNFGEVFRAFDPLLNRDVALKLLKVEQVSVTKSRHFVAEARSLAKVRNRNVLAIHGASMHEGRVGFWADLLSGDTLADTAVDYSTSEQLLAVTAAVTDALSAVHQAGLIHGDVKLSNVMSQDDGKITLMDFGAGGEIDMAASNTGSPILMAPELFNEQPKTAASDIYAMGVMLFKLATGQYPIKADNVLEVMQAHKNNQYESLQALCPDLSKSVRHMINQMILINPQERPNTGAIKDTLNEIKTAPQRRMKRLVIAGLFSVLAIATVVSSWSFFQANEARKTAETEQQKAEVEEQKATAVSGFLAKILKSSRPNISGKNTPMIEILESAEKELENTLIDQPLARSEVLHHIGTSYVRMLAYKQSTRLLDEALALRIQHLGAENTDTLSTQSFLALAYIGLIQADEAKPLLFFDEDRINRLPREYDVRLNFTSTLSSYYQLIGEHEKGEHYARQTMLLVDFEADPVEFHRVRMQLSTILNNHEKFDESEPMLRESLAWSEGKMPRSGLTLGLRNELSSLLGQSGRLDESEKLARVNINLAKTWLGHEDPYLINALTLLSNILNAQSRPAEAIAVNSKALELSQKINGNESWTTLRLMGNQANRLRKQGDIQASKSMYLEVMKSADKFVPPTNSLSYFPRMNLSDLYLEQGDFDAGIELAENTLPHLEAVLGGKNREYIKLRYIYGSLLLGKGDTVAGEKEIKEALVLSKEVLGDDDALTLEILEELEKTTSIQ